MSEFHVVVTRVTDVEKHPNADTLSMGKAHGDYPVIFRTGDFDEHGLAVYVPVDALVPVADPRFAFLDSGHGRTHERVRAKKLRGIFSMGLVVPADPSWKEGQDVQEALGITKWESPEETAASYIKHETTRKARVSETARFDRGVHYIQVAAAFASVASAPWPWWILCLILVIGAGHIAIVRNRKINKKPNVPVYDIEGLRRYGAVFETGELVSISEKIHGCNAKYVHTGKRFHVGSRTMFRGDPSDRWHQAAKMHNLEEKLRAYPGLVLFGEIYGDVQDLHYGVPPEERIRFAAFDVMNLATREYMSVDAFRLFCAQHDIPMVPELYRGPWKPELAELAEGKTTLRDTHVREGIVIKPLFEARHPLIGRKLLKLAGESYLTRKEPSEAEVKKMDRAVGNKRKKAA